MHLNEAGDREGNVFVDGGVLSNFPLSLIAESNPDVWAIMGNTDPGGALNLGLLLDESQPKDNAESNHADQPRLRTVHRVMRLVDAMTSTADSEEMRLRPEAVCRIPVKGYGTTEFRMAPERLKALIQAGNDAMTHYLRENTQLVVAVIEAPPGGGPALVNVAVNAGPAPTGEDTVNEVIVVQPAN